MRVGCNWYRAVRDAIWSPLIWDVEDAGYGGLADRTFNRVDNRIGTGVLSSANRELASREQVCEYFARQR